MNMKRKDQIYEIGQGKAAMKFQKTKLGYAPCDWKKYEIGQCLQLKIRAVNMQDNEIYQLLTVRRDYNGVESRGQYRGKEILVKTQFKVKENDFIISKRQISFGACGLVPKHLDNAIVSNEYNVFIPQRGIDIFFFNYLMQLPRAQNLFF
ncbi:hypothetical protein JQ032_19140 [Clostridium botulinum]|nr:hypothetical protein [Clostridium botulinum]